MSEVSQAADSVRIREDILQSSCEELELDCTGEAWERFLDQERAEAERILREEWSAEEIDGLLDVVFKDTQPLPEDVAEYFRKQDPENADLLPRVGWIARPAESLADSLSQHFAELVTDALIHQETSITWIAEFTGSSGTVALPVIATVSTPERIRAALHKRQVPAVFAVRADLLDASHPRQKLTFVHETQHALDFLRAEAQSPEQWQTLKTQAPTWPVPFSEPTEAAAWAQLELAGKDCPTFQGNRDQLLWDFNAARTLVPRLFFTPLETAAHRAEIGFARQILNLTEDDFLDRIRPENADDIRTWISRVADGEKCALTEFQARDQFILPTAYTDSMRSLFQATQN